MGILNSISSIHGSNKKRSQAVLVEVNSEGDEIKESKYAFQYFPESIHDSRSVNYSTKEVLGSSHPVYQWVHGSERTISFEAVFTADYTDPIPPADPVGDFTAKVGAITNFIKDPLGAVLSSRPLASSNDPDAYSVQQSIAWLRSKTYPKYDGKKPVQPPPLLLLILENSGITAANAAKNNSTGGYIYCLMRQCNVEYHAFFRNGVPRIATVSLEFTESIQVGSNWMFTDRSEVESFWVTKPNIPKVQEK